MHEKGTVERHSENDPFPTLPTLKQEPKKPSHHPSISAGFSFKLPSLSSPSQPPILTKRSGSESSRSAAASPFPVPDTSPSRSQPAKKRLGLRSRSVPAVSEPKANPGYSAMDRSALSPVPTRGNMSMQRDLSETGRISQMSLVSTTSPDADKMSQTQTRTKSTVLPPVQTSKKTTIILKQPPRQAFQMKMPEINRPVAQPTVLVGIPDLRYETGSQVRTSGVDLSVFSPISNEIGRVEDFVKTEKLNDQALDVAKGHLHKVKETTRTLDEINSRVSRVLSDYEKDDFRAFNVDVDPDDASSILAAIDAKKTIETNKMRFGYIMSDFETKASDREDLLRTLNDWFAVMNTMYESFDEELDGPDPDVKLLVEPESSGGKKESFSVENLLTGVQNTKKRIMQLHANIVDLCYYQLFMTDPNGTGDTFKDLRKKVMTATSLAEKLSEELKGTNQSLRESEAKVSLLNRNLERKKIEMKEILQKDGQEIERLRKEMELAHKRHIDQEVVLKKEIEQYKSDPNRFQQAAKSSTEPSNKLREALLSDKPKPQEPNAALVLAQTEERLNKVITQLKQEKARADQKIQQYAFEMDLQIASLRSQLVSTERQMRKQKIQLQKTYEESCSSVVTKKANEFQEDYENFRSMMESERNALISDYETNIERLEEQLKKFSEPRDDSELIARIRSEYEPKIKDLTDKCMELEIALAQRPLQSSGSKRTTKTPETPSKETRRPLSQTSTLSRRSSKIKTPPAVTRPDSKTPEKKNRLRDKIRNKLMPRLSANQTEEQKQISVMQFEMEGLRNSLSEAKAKNEAMQLELLKVSRAQREEEDRLRIAYEEFASRGQQTMKSMVAKTENTLKTYETDLNLKLVKLESDVQRKQKEAIKIYEDLNKKEDTRELDEKSLDKLRKVYEKTVDEISLNFSSKIQAVLNRIAEHYNDFRSEVSKWISTDGLSWVETDDILNALDEFKDEKPSDASVYDLMGRMTLILQSVEMNTFTIMNKEILSLSAGLKKETLTTKRLEEEVLNCHRIVAVKEERISALKETLQKCEMLLEEKGEIVELGELDEDITHDVERYEGLVNQMQEQLQEKIKTELEVHNRRVSTIQEDLSSRFDQVSEKKLETTSSRQLGRTGTRGSFANSSMDMRLREKSPLTTAHGMQTSPMVGTSELVGTTDSLAQEMDSAQQTELTMTDINQMASASQRPSSRAQSTGHTQSREKTPQSHKLLPATQMTQTSPFSSTPHTPDVLLMGRTTQTSYAEGMAQITQTSSLLSIPKTPDVYLAAQTTQTSESPYVELNARMTQTSPYPSIPQTPSLSLIQSTQLVGSVVEDLQSMDTSYLRPDSSYARETDKIRSELEHYLKEAGRLMGLLHERDESINDKEKVIGALQKSIEHNIQLIESLEKKLLESKADNEKEKEWRLQNTLASSKDSRGKYEILRLERQITDCEKVIQQLREVILSFDPDFDFDKIKSFFYKTNAKKAIGIEIEIPTVGLEGHNHSDLITRDKFLRKEKVKATVKLMEEKHNFMKVQEEIKATSDPKDISLLRRLKQRYQDQIQKWKERRMKLIDLRTQNLELILIGSGLLTRPDSVMQDRVTHSIEMLHQAKDSDAFSVISKHHRDLDTIPSTKKFTRFVNPNTTPNISMRGSAILGQSLTSPKPHALKTTSDMSKSVSADEVSANVSYQLAKQIGSTANKLRKGKISVGSDDMPENLRRTKVKINTPFSLTGRNLLDNESSDSGDNLPME